MLPKSMTTPNDIIDITNKEVYLGEFTDDDKTEIVALDDDGNRTIAMKGVTLYRLIDKNHETIAQQDPTSLFTDLSAVLNHGDFAIAYVHPPYNDINDYHWKVMVVSEVVDIKQPIMIKSNRVATETEASTFDGLFPGWLEAVKKFDKVSENINTKSDTVSIQ